MRSQKVFPGAILRDDDLDSDLVLNAAMKGLVFFFFTWASPARGWDEIFIDSVLQVRKQGLRV